MTARGKKTKKQKHDDTRKKGPVQTRQERVGEHQAGRERQAKGQEGCPERQNK